MVIELSGVQFGLKSYLWFENRTSAQLEFDLKSQVWFQTKITVVKYCGKKQIKCGLAWYIVLSTTIRVITVVKMLWTHEAQPSESATNIISKKRHRLWFESARAALCQWAACTRQTLSKTFANSLNMQKQFQKVLGKRMMTRTRYR